MRIKFLLLSVLTGLLAVSCSRKVEIPKYYILQPPESDVPVDTLRPPLTDYFCEISPSEIDPVFSSIKIAVRSQPYEVSYFFYHKWAVMPRQAITHFLEQEVRRSHIFKGAEVDLYRASPEYQINSSVEIMEFLEKGEKSAAHLVATLRLFRNKKEVEVVSHHFNRTELLDRKNLNDFAAGISQILHQEIQVFLKKIEQRITQVQTNTQ